MKVTFYGHATLLVETGDTRILFDPFITPNEKASHIDIKSINPNYIFLSHGHADHVADAVEIAKMSGAKVISNYEIVLWLGNQGVENAHPVNHGGKVNLDFGSAKYVNAVHTSSFPDGSYAGNPGGWVIDTKEGSFYFAGDTALTMDMKLIPMEYKLRFAILPIGDNFTMGVDDAVHASDFILCDDIIGCHFDTFPPIEIDHQEAINKFAARGKELTLLAIGESKEYD